MAWIIAGCVLLIDRLTKAAVLQFMHLGQSIPLVPPLLHLTYVQNTGAAFGLFKGMGWVLMALAVVVVGWVIVELRRRPPVSALRRAAYGFILGGAVGNFIDRLWLGHVIDMIDLRVWPVFNIADSSITIGVVCILLPLMFKTRGQPQ